MMLENNDYRPTTDGIIASTSKQSIQTLTTTIGFQRCEESALEVLTDLTLKFMFKVCQQTQLLKDHVGSSDTRIEEVLHSLNDFKITVPEINRYICKTPSISPPINLPLFPVNIDCHRKPQNQLTEKEIAYRKINDIPDFLPPIWPEECKPKAEKESSKEPLRKPNQTCFIGPLKTTATTESFQLNEKLPEFEINIQMLPSATTSWRSSSRDFILRNPKNTVPHLPDKMVTEDEIKIGDDTVCQNLQTDASAAVTFKNDDGNMSNDVSVKQKPPKRKSESCFIERDDVKKSKREEPPSKCYNSSSSKEQSASPYQNVMKFEKDLSKPSNSLLLKNSDSSSSSISPLPKLRDVVPCKPLSSSLNDYKVSPRPDSSTTVAAAASQCKSRQSSSSQLTFKKNSSASQLSRIRKNIRMSNASVSSLPATKSRLPANKNQKQSTKSTSASFTPPPITGGKSIKMKPVRKNQQSKNCKSQNSTPNAKNPQCELLADNGIKMIIRLPKKV